MKYFFDRILVNCKRVCARNYVTVYWTAGCMCDGYVNSVQNSLCWNVFGCTYFKTHLLL